MSYNREEHMIQRESHGWSTRGKYQNEPKKNILIKDLSDSHLLHVIGFVLNNGENLLSHYGIDLILNEAIFRHTEKIWVGEYLDDFKFGK